MSYLLDALKKAERERTAQQQNPTATAQGEYLQQRGSLGWVIFAVFGAGVMLATLAFVFLPGQSHVQEDLTQEITAQESEAVPLPPAEANAQPAAQVANPQAEPVQNNHENIVFDLADLSPPQLAKVPTLRFQSYFYSQDAKFRSVGINDQVYKEGALLAPGTVLKSITVEGVVLRVGDFNMLLPKGMDWIKPSDAQ
ncbi:MAG: general secretion pathway protein GspB [Oceanospirillaceae bacterium]|nr:general secretion pathway protein GspB [Oceanospirillaceae bacterium]MCP5349445.1 general secretion pathway protein GspB [Oceanospirillaceae bacterium]